MLTQKMQGQRKRKNVTLIDENSYVELKRSMMSIDDDIADVGACMLAMVVMSVIVVILMGRKGSALMKVQVGAVITIIIIITIIKKGQCIEGLGWGC